MAYPTVAIAHDYLTQRGGAERVVLALARAFPGAPIHTHFYDPEQTYPQFRDLDVRPGPLNRIGALRDDPRRALPLLAPASHRMRIDADVVIASSSGWAHAFPTRGRRIVYCHSPARWLYLPGDYLGGPWYRSGKGMALAALAPWLRHFDQRAAHDPRSTYLANSSVVAERIRRVYALDAATLFPPFSPDVAQGAQEEIPALAGFTDGGDYHLVVSRLMPYKNVDTVIEAFARMPQRKLVVIGRGPLGAQLRACAPRNVRLIEGLSDAQMRWAYAHSLALIAASHEDFGLTPLEVGAHGRPTLALRAGGYLDTVVPSLNGLFFDHPTPGAIEQVVSDAEQPWDADAIRAHADTFSEQRFIAALHGLIADQAAAFELAGPGSSSV